MNVEEVLELTKEHELVMAPAGAGKTHLISTTINSLIESGVSPEKILCITFTNLACRNMRKVVHGDVTVSTIHSLIYKQVVKKNKNYIADDSCTITVLEEMLLEKFGREASKSEVQELIKEMGRYASMAVYSTERLGYKDFIDKVNSCEMDSYYIDKCKEVKIDPSIVGDCYRKLLNYYACNNLVDYNLMIIQGVFDLRLDVEHIFIDEFQDILYQEFLAATKINDNACLRLYGDLNQSIYTWRGAVPNYIIKIFRNTYHPKEIYLDKIYRSKSNIVSLGNRLLNKVDDGYSYVSEGGLVVCKPFETTDSEVSWVCDNIMKDLSDNKRVAILSRKNMSLVPYLDYFKKQGTKYHYKAPSSYRADPCVNICTQLLGMRAETFSDFRIHALLYSEAIRKEAGVTRKDLDNLCINKYPVHLLSKGASYYYPLIDLESRRNRTFVIFDVESTGLQVGTDRIIQISGIKLDENFNQLDELDVIINPDKSVGESEKTHHFSDEFLKANGVDSFTGLKSFVDFIGDSILVGHNVSYDKSMLECECSRVGLELGDTIYYDTLSISRYTIDSTSYRLGDLIETLGIEANPNHNAMEDVRATVKLFKHLCDGLRTQLNVFELCYKPEGNVKTYINYVLEMYDACINCELENIFRVANKYISGFGISIDRRKSIVSLNESLLAILRDEPDATINEIYSALSLNALPPTLEMDLSILTVHQSKGLEWDTVYLVDCSSKYRQSSEDLRIEYVATTRARDELYITYCNCNGSPSNIVNELSGDC